MGFLDVLTGKRKIKQPAPDRLFAMATAGVTLETEMDLKSAGKAAIVFQPLGTDLGLQAHLALGVALLVAARGHERIEGAALVVVDPVDGLVLCLSLIHI